MPTVKTSLITILWAIVLVSSQAPYFLPTLLAIALHELGHILFAFLLKIKIKCFHLSLLGARLEIVGEISYKKELLLALGGPLFGVLGFAFSISPALNYELESLLNFSVISLILALFNLLPLESLDGGRMLKCTLCLCFKLKTANKIMSLACFLTLFTLWMFSVYVMLKIASGLQTFVFCSFFFAKCFIFNEKNGDLTSF